MTRIRTWNRSGGRGPTSRRRVRAFVDGLGEAGVSRVFEYKLLSGASGASPFSEMLTHVVNHGSYHRGQVTTLLRQLGARAAEEHRHDHVLSAA